MVARLVKRQAGLLPRCGLHRGQKDRQQARQFQTCALEGITQRILLDAGAEESWCRAVPRNCSPCALEKEGEPMMLKTGGGRESRAEGRPCAGAAGGEWRKGSPQRWAARINVPRESLSLFYVRGREMGFMFPNHPGRREGILI